MKVFRPEELPALLSGSAAADGLEVEIGCGNGHFIAEYADRRRSSLLLGVELKQKRCLKAAEKAEKRGLDNVAIVQGRAEDVISRLAEGSVSRYHIYFPDPWPKTKHRRRRFFRWDNLDRLATTLRPGGRVHFVSDVFDYCLQARILLILHPGFELSPEPPEQEILLSIFGKKFMGLGREIHAVTGLRRAAPAEGTPVSGSDN